ncbi:TonB-dependent siderophore receptor [Sphingomonas sp. AP4-R1]|uniref:TonB-dependent receptor plug domain-containing protein n=1 Tax=Sphingomonas sp. AP4-R1 TaxID=2735134 RepID=UPI0020A33059|nr:TonB-dependent receptor [Sphingomonas sp. AP4-R1]
MSKSPLRASVAALALALGIMPGAAHAQPRAGLSLPSATLSASLDALSRAANVEILADPALLRGRQAPAVRAAADAEAALAQLLHGTGLTYQKRGGTFLIVQGPSPAPSATGPRRKSEPAMASHAPEEPALASVPDDEVVVTGSRIARPELESAMPVSVVNIAQAERFGRTTAYDALMREPSVGVGIGPTSSFGQSWDAGISTVSLRNLGTNRSLTLIDGMRRVSGSAQSSAVDLSMIPGGMIERIEVVTGGAAAIYGADAVTGAVNVITKRDYKGLEISAQNGVSTYGDMRRLTVSLVGGGTFDDGRGSFIIGGTYTKSPELADADRSFARNFSIYLANPKNTGPNDGIPDQLLIRNYAGIYISPVPTFYYGGNSYLYQNGSLVKGTYDTQYLTGEFGGGTGGTTYPNNSTRGYMIAQQLDTFSAISRFSYDLTDAIRYTGRIDYGESKSVNRAETYRDDSRTVWMNGAGGAVAYLDNPYLPAAVRQFMVANGLTKLGIDRAYSNVPKKQEIHERQSINLYSGLDGGIAGRFKWNAFYQYGRSRDNVEASNYPYLSHWKAARDAIADPATGQPVCRDAAARAAGCIPFDIFGTETVTPAQLAYITGGRMEKRVNTQRIYGAGLTGKLFALPYGDLSFSLGGEHRRESLVTRDSAAALGNELIGPGQLDSHPALDASFSVSEVYGELVAPLLRDLPFAHRLEIEGAYRYSNYNTFGGTDTWKGGATWSPIAGLTFRGVRSRSVRAPNFGELYNPQTVSVTGSILDPCGLGRYSNSATRAANCAALGIKTPLPGVYSDALTVTAGGNPDLKPETSNSLTLGAVLQPRFLPGFSITADYWNIDIKNVITQYSYLNTLNLCVDLPSIDNPLCRQVTRGPDGKVTQVRTNQLNASRMRARGIDFGADYRRRMGPGELGITFKGTYLLERLVQTTPGIAAGDVAYDGGYTDPRFKGFLTVSYDVGKFSAAVDTRFISAALYYPDAVSVEYVDQNRIPSRTYNDISVIYRINDGLSFGVGVNNVFNVEPPIFPGLESGGSGRYDAIGRYFFASLKAKIR